MRPACDCHGLPMYWQKDKRCRAGGFWTCAENQRQKVRARYQADPETHRVRRREWYANLSGPRYSLRRLKDRRWKALKRRALRHERRNRED